MVVKLELCILYMYLLLQYYCHIVVLVAVGMYIRFTRRCLYIVNFVNFTFIMNAAAFCTIRKLFYDGRLAGYANSVNLI